MPSEINQGRAPASWEQICAMHYLLLAFTTVQILHKKFTLRDTGLVASQDSGNLSHASLSLQCKQK